MVVEIASIIFIISIGVCIAALTVIGLSNILSNHRRAGRHPEANSIAKFTPDVTPRTQPDQTAQRDRELEKWREEHKAQLERE